MQIEREESSLARQGEGSKQPIPELDMKGTAITWDVFGFMLLGLKKKKGNKTKPSTQAYLLFGTRAPSLLGWM